MPTFRIGQVIVIFCAIVGLALVFQNCAPAKLTGNDPDSSSEPDQVSTVGKVVDLQALIAAGSEPSANVVYPPPNTTATSSYAAGSPMTENIVVKTNDFDLIEWIHGANSTVISNGEVLSARNFNLELAADYYVFGYRGSQSYLIGRFQIVSRAPSSTAATSAGAVQVNQRKIYSDAVDEIFAIDVQAPNVDVREIKFVISPSGASANGRRALLVQKRIAEVVDVQVSVTDTNSRVSTQIVRLAGSAPVTTTTTLPPPTTTTTTMPPLPAVFRIQTRVNNSSYADTNGNGVGSRVHLWSIADNGNQDFSMTAGGALMAHGLCLQPSTATSGSGVFLQVCNGSANQVWTYNSSTGVLRSSLGFCLDLSNSVTANGTTISIFTCNGGLNQSWTLIPR